MWPPIAWSVYYLYKSQDLIERHFLTFKSALLADRLYLQDSWSVFGQNVCGIPLLVSLLSDPEPYRKVNLTPSFPHDVLLLQFSKVYRVIYDTGEVITEVPKKVRELRRNWDWIYSLTEKSLGLIPSLLS